MELDLTNLQVCDTPESLVGIGDVHILKRQSTHLTEELRAIDDAVAHHHVVAVPDGGTRAHLEVAVGDERAIDVPPGIFPNEAASVCLDISAALYARLALGDGYILESGVVNRKQRALASELLIAYDIHLY
jgi:hypothetical protein